VLLTRNTDYPSCIVLHPEMKMKHFTKYWPTDLQTDVRDNIEELVRCTVVSPLCSFMILIWNGEQFKNRYERIYGPSGSAPIAAKKNRTSGSKMASLMRELNSSDERDDDDISHSAIPTDPAKPWMREFNLFLNTVDQLADGQTIIQWWGVSLVRCLRCS
jgi:hypothetical protein